MSRYTVYAPSSSTPLFHRYISERESMLREEIEVYEDRVAAAVVELDILRRELATRRRELAGLKDGGAND